MFAQNCAIWCEIFESVLEGIRITSEQEAQLQEHPKNCSDCRHQYLNFYNRPYPLVPVAPCVNNEPPHNARLYYFPINKRSTVEPCNQACKLRKQSEQLRKQSQQLLEDIQAQWQRFMSLRKVMENSR